MLNTLPSTRVSRSMSCIGSIAPETAPNFAHHLGITKLILLCPMGLNPPCGLELELYLLKKLNNLFGVFWERVLFCSLQIYKGIAVEEVNEPQSKKFDPEICRNDGLVPSLHFAPSPASAHTPNHFNIFCIQQEYVPVSILKEPKQLKL
jgi:hypothetical protein